MALRPTLRLAVRAAMAAILFCAAIQTAFAAEKTTPVVKFDLAAGRVAISVGGDRFADYVYADEQVLRPFFSNVQSAGGTSVTRHFPPREGVDSSDHATMHPGIWLGFGDLSGADFWRNKGRVVHGGFKHAPHADAEGGTFVVENRYEFAGQLICREICRHRIIPRPHGVLITYESEFSNPDREFAFGDQEELGLGFRLDERIKVKGGSGKIVNSAGQVNEAGVWGKTAEWCDYSGTIDDRQVGITLMPSPGNFRPSWFHARDYGFVAANPFGRKAFTKGEPSRVVVSAGETFRLGYGVFVHATANGEAFDPATAYRDYLTVIGRPVKDAH